MAATSTRATARLPTVASANPDLNIYILTWDFSMVFANVRDPKLVLGQNPFKHPRVHLQFDSTHPPGASHHQKIVVIDDAIAFCGGIDLTVRAIERGLRVVEVPIAFVEREEGTSKMNDAIVRAVAGSIGAVA